MAKQQYQTIVLTLSDGQTAQFVGRPQIPTDKEVRVVDIAISPPKELPEGMFWGDPHPKK